VPQDSHLLSTGQVSLGVSACGAIPPGQSDEEIESHFTLVFPLTGVFAVNTEGTRTSATPAKAVLFNKGQVRQIHHPDGGHDQSAYISMKSALAEPYLDRSGRFRVEAGPTTPGIDFWLRNLIAKAIAGRLDALEADEFTVKALAELMEDRRGQPTRGRSDIVLDAEEYLSVNFRDHCDLSTIARNVGASTHHLSRIFKQVTGETLSRRRMRLRLGAVFSEVLDGADDLSRVAVESGFYDHSHMKNSFRSYFGVTPKDARFRGRLKPEMEDL
jgi:AraC-like DNA-binding protein